jgi:predicted  nucleic acid-binding Zn-ribbon protein
MDGPTGTEPTDGKTTYTTSKQVQAWFLKRSRDRWKQKARQNNAELKRLRQRVADVEASRAHWREQAETAQQAIERLQPAMAPLQARLDQQAEDASQKKRTPSPA